MASTYTASMVLLASLVSLFIGFLIGYWWASRD